MQAARLSRLFLRPSVRLTRAAAARAAGRPPADPVYNDSYGDFDDDDGCGDYGARELENVLQIQGLRLSAEDLGFKKANTNVAVRRLIWRFCEEM